MNNTAGNDKSTITVGSGNVFADLEFPDPGLAQAKAELALQIHETIRRRGWTQTKAAAVMGIDQPKVSAIVRGRLSDFSLDRLVTCLGRLGRTVQFRFGTQPDGQRRTGPSRSKRRGTAARRRVTRKVTPKAVPGRT
jgi:predicted XRE-type DNA-binding protein